MNTQVRILTGEPIVALIGEMSLVERGVMEMVEWVREVNPECVPEEYDAKKKSFPGSPTNALFPHDMYAEASPNDPPNQTVAERRVDSATGKEVWEDVVVDARRPLTHNELLVELCGRKCYNSFGAKAGRKSNREYIEHTQSGEVPHGSIMYHAKLSFFIAGVSRRVSHELIRHYVGADRDEEGSPSQESTRYVEHAGRYIAHPAILDDQIELDIFRMAMQTNYGAYLGYIQRQEAKYQAAFGEKAKGMAKKRIFESASPLLSHACETSWIWTTNPIALAKLLKERAHEAADLEFARLATKWGRLVMRHAPNLFPQPWMQAFR